eukprot:g6042.t1
MPRASSSVMEIAKETLLKPKPKGTRITIERDSTTSLVIDRPQYRLLWAMLGVIVFYTAINTIKDALFWGMNEAMFTARIMLLIPILVCMHFTWKPIPWYLGQQTMTIRAQDFDITTWKVLAYHEDFTFKWKRWVNTSRRHKVQGNSEDLVSAKITTLGEGWIKSRVRYIEMCEGEDKKHKFGLGLTRPEQEWIADHINDFLSELASAAKETHV